VPSQRDANARLDEGMTAAVAGARQGATVGLGPPAGGVRSLDRRERHDREAWQGPVDLGPPRCLAGHPTTNRADPFIPPGTLGIALQS